MKRKDQSENKIIDQQITLSKTTMSLRLSNCSLNKFPAQVFTLKNLKILDLGFNNIEAIPETIAQFNQLEQFYINNNPLQFVPIDISECRNLRIFNSANTFVKYIPREMANNKKLYVLDLTNCPLKGKLAEVYPLGIVELFKYLQRKMDRSIYRELIVKKLKEWVYMGNTIQEIQEMMQIVMDNLKEVETKTLKRLLRNLQNIFPIKIEDVDATIIRSKLFSTLSQTQTLKN